MNLYLAIYNRNKHELSAATSYEAQQLALVYFQANYARKKLRGSDIIIILLEIDNQPIVQNITH